MDQATFLTSDLTRFTRLDELGLVATGQHLETDHAWIQARPATTTPWCSSWGPGASRAAR